MDLAHKYESPGAVNVSDESKIKKDYPTICFPTEAKLKVGAEITFTATGVVKRIEETEQNGIEITLELKDGDVKARKAESADEAVTRAIDEMDKAD